MDFLFELGLEEVPARMIAAAQAELAKRLTGLLERERLIVAGTTTQSFSTPRRLAFHIEGVAERQQDLAEELIGPATKIAYKDGAPTPAAHAFAKKAGVAVESLRRIETPKGEYLAATATRPGRTAAEILLAELPRELAGIYWPKNMYWRPGKPQRFVRPVRWMLALLDDTIVPVEFAGFTASNLTFGHRILYGNEPIKIAAPASYPAALRAASVEPDVELRRHTIRKALDRVCRTIPDTRWREDHALVDKLTHLTEWASVLSGSFDAAFLELPEEVLVTVMRDHQNYFAVEDTNGTLAPHFLAVLNTAPDSQAESIIRHGNERVLRARFNDARFFWHFDQRTPLVARVDLLNNVTFQKDLGSYAEKSKRVAFLCDPLAALAASRGSIVDHAALILAAQLAKTDLTTELVKEFTELQGIVGGLYARAQGHSEAAARAIYDQYRPLAMDAPIPTTNEGCLLAIADKADTIAGMFSLGLEPTGSKDPFALRRAANGIVRILAESGLPLTLTEIMQATGAEAATRQRALAFFTERLDFFLREAEGHNYDIVKAVLANTNDDVRDAVARARALTQVRSSEDFAAVSAAFKRMKNILAQAETTRSSETSASPAAPIDLIDPAGPVEPAQKLLAEASAKVHAEVAALAAERNYIAALEAIATLRPAVDRFFTDVMVLDPNPAIRQLRLSLLAEIVQTIQSIADLSEIVSSSQP